MPRRLGQHFLARPSILERIAEAACPTPVPLAIEIGPGKGALTGPLLGHASKVAAIEIDPFLVHYLHHQFRDAIEQGQLEVIEGDVLKADLSALLPGGARAVLTGNLPYYITSPILDRVFAMAGKWERAVFLVQAEVAARLAASPGTRDYGYLSVLAQIYSRPEILFEVPRGAFRPPPKVDSAVVRLEPRAAAEMPPDPAGFLRFAGLCFQHKRKTLRNNLAPVFGRERVDALAEAAARAEQLSVAQLLAIYRRLEPSAREVA